MVNLHIMHSPGRHMDPFSTASNFGYATSLDNSSDKEYWILCPKRHAMLVSSVLFVSNLICYGIQYALGSFKSPIGDSIGLG